MYALMPALQKPTHLPAFQGLVRARTFTLQPTPSRLPVKVGRLLAIEGESTASLSTRTAVHSICTVSISTLVRDVACYLNWTAR